MGNMEKLLLKMTIDSYIKRKFHPLLFITYRRKNWLNHGGGESFPSLGFLGSRICKCSFMLLCGTGLLSGARRQAFQRKPLHSVVKAFSFSSLSFEQFHSFVHNQKQWDLCLCNIHKCTVYTIVKMKNIHQASVVLRHQSLDRWHKINVPWKWF